MGTGSRQTIYPSITEKLKTLFFIKKFSKDSLPLKLPALKIADNNIGRKTAIKFLGVMLVENISWEEHVRTVETKLAKNIGLIYRAKHLLEEKSLKSIYFAYIHSYLNYVNIAWGSTYRTKLKAIHFHQKHAVSIVFNEDKLAKSCPLLRSLNALNVYQINPYQHLAFMYKLNKNKAPLTFNELFKKPFHKYPTKFSENCFSFKAISLKSRKYYFFPWSKNLE